MTSSESLSHSLVPKDKWLVYRQDDNGNKFVMEKNLTQDEAERLVKQFEARGHERVYWAQPQQ